MVTVRKKKNIQTDPSHLSGSLSDLQLNNSLGGNSVANFKTLSNSSRGGRVLDFTPVIKSAHNDESCSSKHSASKEDFVFVLNKNGQPLMPTKSGKARRMLKSGIAKVVTTRPFVIKMLVETCEYKQKASLGVDAGSKVIGVAVISNGKVIYLAEVKPRQDIKGKIDQRRMYRRTRRGRKLRYRAARFNNRGRKTGWLTPTLRSKIQAHEREIKFVKSILPISKLIIETASFDIHKITSPDVEINDYQKGRQLGFYNVKSFVLSRDKYKCQKCFGKYKCDKLHVHHILFRSNGGTNSPDNLVTICEFCHNELHAKPNAQTESHKLTKKRRANTTDATQVTTISSMLRKSNVIGKFEETFGYITKFNRENNGLDKQHYNDAIAIACKGELISSFTNIILKKKCVPRGDYQQTFGKHSQKRYPTGKLFGFRKFDLVKTEKGIGFIKGKRSTGYFSVADIDGLKVSDSVNIKKNSKRLTSRGSLILEAQFLPVSRDRVSMRKII